MNKQKKKNGKSFQNTVILGCGKNTIKHYTIMISSFQTGNYGVCKISFALTFSKRNIVVNDILGKRKENVRFLLPLS